MEIYRTCEACGKSRTICVPYDLINRHYICLPCAMKFEESPDEREKFEKEMKKIQPKGNPMSQTIVISPEAVSEVNQKIKELKETLEKHNLLMVFNTEIGEGFLFPNTYKVCSVDDPEYDEADPTDLPMSVDGIRTKIGDCMSTFDKHCNAIISTKR